MIWAPLTRKKYVLRVDYFQGTQHNLKSMGQEQGSLISFTVVALQKSEHKMWFVKSALLG